MGASAESGILGFITVTAVVREAGVTPWLEETEVPGPSDATARAPGCGPSCVLEIKVPCAASAADELSGAAGSAPQLALPPLFPQSSHL